jgi:starvation-inducible DNA-binding protein
MQPTHNTLPAEIRTQSVDLLNQHLAAAIDLHGQIKQAHWNVRGAGFIAVHELFDTIAGQVLALVDTIAERTAALGGTAQGTIQTAAKTSFLVPYPHGIAPVKDHLFAVASSLAAFGESARKSIDTASEFGDADTADLFTAASREIDQALWFVEAHQEPKSSNH